MNKTITKSNGQLVVFRLNSGVKHWTQGTVTQQIKHRSYIVDINLVVQSGS